MSEIDSAYEWERPVRSTPLPEIKTIAPESKEPSTNKTQHDLPYPVVAILWEDAWSRDEWTSSDEIESTMEEKDGLTWVVGFLLFDRPAFVIVAAATGMYSDRKKSDIWRIPRSAIISMKTL